MLKSYAGKKISQIMEKTTVDFISVASSIYHCFSFWILLWWCQMLTLFDIRHPALRGPGIYCLWLTPSVVNLVALHSAVRLKHHRWGRVSPERGAIASPQADATQGECSAWARWPLQYGGMTQHEDPGGCSLSSLPNATVPSLSSGISSPLCTPLCQSPG